MVPSTSGSSTGGFTRAGSPIVCLLAVIAYALFSHIVVFKLRVDVPLADRPPEAPCARQVDLDVASGDRGERGGRDGGTGPGGDLRPRAVVGRHQDGVVARV